MLLALAAFSAPATAARAGFHVQFPWVIRKQANVVPKGMRQVMQSFLPFCGDIIRNPQIYSGNDTTFLSFSGNSGDLVTVIYTSNRAPRSREDFTIPIVADVPIHPSGQLCFNVTMPAVSLFPQYGVFYFEARDPKTEEIEYFCSDVKLKDDIILAVEHPAMCAGNNETLIPMPDEYL
ncbi:hypothetical protein BDK51DRAFT_17434 [Blyttiomyces helicus]|uniref:Ubiquitin 3 binding protein But2 C-terminal domain-containing protein n=1 Tax=Blyttiomyces helicus TaxID=388810 RepID=A0A4P9WLZ7_9FUNG|nr:hypothetical protein BDK51DRAFT_17434 [Blyttiomyces helicus]|eukprot:RKO93225.1 hypothetical protein BDK51DRAFT_17434 [Blyttiomyces helicus]